MYPQMLEPFVRTWYMVEEHLKHNRISVATIRDMRHKAMTFAAREDRH